MKLRNAWSRSQKIKARAEELFLEPDLDGAPANSLSSIIEKLRAEFGQSAKDISTDLILEWANKPCKGIAYTWAELRIISQTPPQLKASPDSKGVCWKEEILRKIELTEIDDRTCQEELAKKSRAVILQNEEAKIGLMDAVIINNASSDRMAPRRFRKR